MNAVHDDDQRTHDIGDARSHDSDTHARHAGHAPALIAGRYRLVRQLGQGANGVVYEACDEARAGLRVAVKLLLTSHPQALTRLKNEFRALCETVHPNLVGLHGLGVDARGWFVVMDLIAPQRDLLSYVRGLDHGSCDAGRLRAAFVQLAHGVRAIHGAGKLHRDLKPSNVLVTDEGRVVVADFGLISAQQTAPGDTAEGWFVGTPAYAAPEQAYGRPVGPAADMYALGAMLFECLTGRLPVEAATTAGLLLAKDAPLAADVLALLDGAPPDLAQLARALLARDPAQRPDAEQLLRVLGERAATSPVAESSPFVGRESELQLLVDNAERARDGAPPVVLVSGVSGIGKSALVERFTQIVQRTRGALVLRGRCHAHEQVPYKAFDNLIDELGRHLLHLPPLDAASLMPRDVWLLAKLFPTLGRVGAVAQMPGAPARPLDSALLRTRAFAALKELLARIADRRLLVLCFDDLQWSDEDSGELLRELVRGADAPACLFVCTFRPDAELSARLFAELPPETCLALPLSPLPRADALRMTRSLLSARLDDRELETLVDEAAGSPFLIAELSRGAQKYGSLRRLDQLVQARIAELDEHGRTLLELVSVAGQPIDTSLALDAAALPPEVLAQVVSSALTRVHALGDRELIDCSHARIRDAAIATIPTTRRVRHQRRLAEALCSDPAADPERIARHFLAADAPAEAQPHLVRAAEHAASVLAFARAAELYARALPQAKAGESEALELALAEALASVGRVTLAAAHYERVMARTGDAARRTEFGSSAMMLHLLAGDRDAGTRLLNPLCRELGISPVPRVRVLALLLQLFLIARYVLAPRIVNRPVPSVSRHRGSSAHALMLCFRATRGFAHLSLGYSQYFALRAMISTRKHRDPRFWPVAMSWDVLVRCVLRGAVRARDERDMERALALAEASDDGETLALVWAAEGGRCFATGQLSRSVQALRRSEEAIEARGRSVLSIFNGSRTGQMAGWIMTGELHEIEAHAEPWLAEARAVGDTLGEFTLRIMSAFRYLARDQPERMRREVSALHSPLGAQSMFGADVWWFGEPALYEQDADAALAALAAARASRYFPAVERAAAHRVWIHLYAGRASLLAATRGDTARHLAAVKRAIRKLARERYRAVPAMIQHLQAGLALAHGDDAGALRGLAAAAAGYDMAEMHMFAATMRFHAGVLRGADGAAEVASAIDRARTLGAHAPERWFHSFLPGRSAAQTAGSR